MRSSRRPAMKKWNNCWRKSVNRREDESAARPVSPMAPAGMTRISPKADKTVPHIHKEKNMAMSMRSELVRIPAESVQIEGMLEIPQDSLGIVLFAHGSGSSRFSTRNNYVAGEL